MIKLNTMVIAGLAVSSVLAGCVQKTGTDDTVTAEVAPSAETSTPEATPKALPAYETVKPGASVDILHDIKGPVVAGENAAVELTVLEGYPSGVLTLEARGEEGLEVFGAQTTARMDMADGTRHSWRVDFRAESDGLYYLNLMATAEPEDGIMERRAHAIRIEVGDWEAAQLKLQGPATETLESGEQAVIMEAEETIED